MSSKKLLVNTTEKWAKKELMTQKQNPMWKRNPLLLPLQKIKLTQSTQKKPQASKSKKDKSIRNESDKGRSLDKSSSLKKSRSNKIAEKEDTVKTPNKSRSVSSAIFLIKVPK